MYTKSLRSSSEFLSFSQEIIMRKVIPAALILAPLTPGNITQRMLLKNQQAR
jgi:hypothetical protein